MGERLSSKKGDQSTRLCVVEVDGHRYHCNKHDLTLSPQQP